MSARILYSLTDDKSVRGRTQKQHIGCMNGIFHLFDRGHSLSGGRRPVAVPRNRLPAGQDRNCDAEEDTMSIKSTGKVSKSISTDSSRTSGSSSCYSSGFSSSVEDNTRLAKMEPMSMPITVNTAEKSAKDLPRLRRGNDSDSKSGATTYVDSPRPVLPLKVRERNSAASVSLRDFSSLQRTRNFADSPRFSYDGRESRDMIGSNAMKLREQPRHSLDSKWQSSVVAKLMGLESASDTAVGSDPRTKHGRNHQRVDVLDTFSVSSRTTNEYNHEPRTDLVVRLNSNTSQVLDKTALVTKESPSQSPGVSVYGELEKRLEQIEFKRSGKDLRALKQILEAMQKSKRVEDRRKHIHRGVVVAETCNVGRSDFKPACSVNPRGTQRSSSDRRRSESLPPMSSSRYARYLPSDCTGRNHWNSSARPLKSKKPKLTDSPTRSNRPLRQQREPASPRRVPKSKATRDLIVGNAVSMQSDEDSEASIYRVEHEEKTPKLGLQSEVDDDSPLKRGIVQAEQPSPVSVLDPTYSEDESPIRFHGQDRDLHVSAESVPDKKHDRTYILQTLTSTGLLGNPDAGNSTTVQFLRSAAIMNDLFLSPEPDKQSRLNRSERIQRRLLFDVIDEIMVKNRFLPFGPAAEKTRQEQLLQGLCSEIAQLRSDNYKRDVDDEKGGDYVEAVLRRDMERESRSWNGRLDDSGLVLDIERLIFKDLVTEVVTC